MATLEVLQRPSSVLVGLRQRFTSDDSEKGLALIVDGDPIDLQNLGSIPESHEGWRFRLVISDPAD